MYIFQTHTTDKLFVVHHGLANGGSSVMIFNVIDKTSNYDATRTVCVGDVSNIRLKYVRSIRSPLFLNLGPNDVIEGFTDKTSSEVYLTQWLQYAAPLGGKTNPKGWKETLHFIGQEMVPSYSQAPLTICILIYSPI